MSAPRFIASDIDGTFLDNNHRVSKQTREVVLRAADAGAQFALATGRPHRWIAPVLEQLPLRPLCVTSNGAVIYDSRADRVVRAVELAPEVMGDVVATAQEIFARHGGVSVAAERAGRSAADPLEELYIVDETYAESTEFRGFGVHSALDVVAAPAVKLILRNLGLSSLEMFELLAPHVDPADAHVTYSMSEGLLEVAAPGVTKALGVSELAAGYGVDAADVIVFGDMPNDIEMIRWAGRGIAMGNAAQVVKDAADEITAPNHQGGVAAVLERWF